jgi:NAD(P)H-dependent FMN reductase
LGAAIPSNAMVLVQVILGSTRDGRFSHRAGQWVVETLAQRGDMEIELEMAPLRHAVNILPDVLIPALRAEVFEPSMLDALAPRIQLMDDDLHWWASALAAARQKVG